jgi:hypothetical protein
VVTAGLALVVVLELAVVGLALALAHPPAGRRLQRLVGTAALLAGGVLALYGGVLVAVGAPALAWVLGEPADPTALRWHVLFWNRGPCCGVCCSSSLCSPDDGCPAVARPGERQVAGGFTRPTPVRHAGVGPPH